MSGTSLIIAWLHLKVIPLLAIHWESPLLIDLLVEWAQQPGGVREGPISKWISSRRLESHRVRAQSLPLTASGSTGPCFMNSVTIDGDLSPQGQLLIRVFLCTGQCSRAFEWSWVSKGPCVFRERVTQRTCDHVLKEVSSLSMRAAQHPGTCDRLRGGPQDTSICGCSSVIQRTWHLI